MDFKSAALIISKNEVFISKYSQILKNNHFKIIKSNSINSWKSDSSNKIDICFVDNLNGDFNYPHFFSKINENNQQSLIINVSKNNHHISTNHNLFYTLNPQLQTIDLEVFIENINQLLKREKSRTELAATLLHDLRSPLNSLITYTELLLNETFGKLNDGQKKFLEKAMVIGDQILDMLEEINEVYQNEQYTFHLEREYFSLYKLIDEVMLNIWVQADAKNIKIKKEISENIKDIYGDPFQINRVLMNLLGNSIKYSPPNSTIILTANTKGKTSIEIEVKDNGGGLPESQLKKIFHKFYQIKENEIPKKGQGLGLYISRLIVKAHNGKIQAANNDIGGLSFTFSLPLN